MPADYATVGGGVRGSGLAVNFATRLCARRYAEARIDTLEHCKNMPMDEADQRIDATFSPNYAERLRAEWFLLTRSPVSLLAALTFPAAGGWLVWLLLSHPESAPGSAWFVVLLAFGFSPSVFFFNSYRSHRAMMAKGAFTYVFDREGFHVSTRLANSFQRWPAILRVETSRSLLLLYFSKRCAHFVPIRALPDAGAVDVVQQLASAGGVPRVGA